MSPASDVNRVRFARFVARALEDARHRGMTDPQIAKATCIGTSTFHRWQRGEFRQAPELDKVRAFCAGLGVPLADAVAALGLSERREPTPEPPMDPDVRIILRALADPSVSTRDKEVIREMIAMIANRHRHRRERGKEAG